MKLFIAKRTTWITQRKRYGRINRINKMHINWHDYNYGLPLSYRVKIKQALQLLAKNNNQYKRKMISVVFVGTDKICEYNTTYRQKNEPTDVLSFPRANVPKNHYDLGDIIICIDIAEKQAKEYNHSLERELAFLAVHGMLHILGYNHDTPEEEEIMLQAQKEVLDKVGLPR